MKQTLLILIGATLILAACTTSQSGGCTKEIRACPGGEGVGRVPPTCEFASCPTPACDHSSDPSLNYIGKSTEECSLIRFTCLPGTEYFTNDCGCGCKEIAQPDLSHDCLPEERNVGACDTVYAPVCGYFDPSKIQCIKAPCAQTYSNGCVACDDEKVLSWIEGECPDD